MSKKTEHIDALLAPTIAAMGFIYWGCEYLAQGKYSVLRVFIDNAEGVTADDCGSVSKQLMALLAVEETIKGEYSLEVSSPGIDRPLFTVEQFQAYLNEQVQIRLQTGIEGRRNFSGVLQQVDASELIILVDNETYTLPFADIDKANVVPTWE